jgi:lysophospholipase L1-like esterase
MKKLSTSINIFLFSILLIISFKENYPQRLYRRLFTDQRIETKQYLNNFQWQSRENYFDQDTVLHYDVVMIGNSITQGGLWEQLLNCTSVKNLGIGNDISEGVLNRVDRAIKYHPKFVFVEIGVNDISNNIPIDIILNNYSKIASRLSTAKITTCITSVIFVGKEYPNAVETNKKIDDLNKKLMLLSKDKIHFIDLNKKLVNNGFLKPNLTYDQIHLSPKGYLIYGGIVNDFITSSKSNQTHQRLK